jgi:hypothetical protein
MTAAFGAHGKKRLNRVFDVIGFVYPYYCFLVQKQGRKKESHYFDIFWCAEGEESQGLDT